MTNSPSAPPRAIQPASCGFFYAFSPPESPASTASARL
nr:MAG TPA: hypothetical protein [Caudoviricetes sp.]